MAVVSKYSAGMNAVPLVAIERNWTRDGGWTAVYTYTGPWASIDAAKTDSNFVGNAVNVSVTKDKNLGTMRVTYSSTDNAAPDPYTEQSNTWTLVPYEIQRDLGEHPRFANLKSHQSGYLTVLDQTVEQYFDDVKAGIAAQNSSKDKVWNLYKTNSSGASQTGYQDRPGSETIAVLGEEYTELLAEGINTFDNSKYTLRNTIVVPQGTSLKASHAYTGYQWTNLSVAALVLSSTGNTVQNSIVGDLVENFPNTFWLKKAPTIVSLRGGKYEIRTEFVNYESGEKSTTLYPVYSAP